MCAERDVDFLRKINTSLTLSVNHISNHGSHGLAIHEQYIAFRRMAAVGVVCGDFLEFQDALQKMRQLDDKIIHMLNTTLPTESFKAQVDPKQKCKDLYEEIETGHKQREAAITKCLNASRDRINHLKQRRENGEETPELLKQLRKEQTTWRLIQSELNVEDVVRQRTLKAYYERCRTFFKPDGLQK